MHDLIGGRESAGGDGGAELSWWEQDLAGQRMDVAGNHLGGGLRKVEQTEFWTETASSRLRSTASSVPSAADDYFLDDDFDDAPAMKVIVMDEDEDKDEEESRQLLDVSESIDSIERRRQEASEAEARLSKRAAAASAPEERSRPRGAVYRPTYAQQDAPTPRFNMTRLLRLTGSLDAVDDREHWYDLPARHIRTFFTLGAKRSQISRDFHKDLNAPPRGVTIRKYGRSEGSLSLK